MNPKLAQARPAKTTKVSSKAPRIGNLGCSDILGGRRTWGRPPEQPPSGVSEIRRRNWKVFALSPLGLGVRDSRRKSKPCYGRGAGGFCDLVFAWVLSESNQ